MKKNVIFIVSFLVLIFVIFLINIYKPIKILQDTKQVEEIRIYDIDSEKSVDISDKDKINTYVTEVKKLEFKKSKPVGNSSARGLVIIFIDESGNTIDTLYTSEKGLIYHHWLVNIIKGANPYEILLTEFNN